MSADPVGQVTQLLQAAGSGDSRAAAELLPLLYSELRKLAQSRLSRTPVGNTLQPTALVHEAYLRLVGGEDPGWNSRGHFFAAAAQAMRQILVEQARRKGSFKRGGGRKRVDIDDADPADEARSDELLALDEMLDRLESYDARKARIVMLRHFAGLSMAETAEAMGVSESTIEREWRFTKALLRSWLDDEPAPRDADGGRES